MDVIVVVLLGLVLGSGVLVSASAFGVGQPLSTAWARHGPSPDGAARRFAFDYPSPLGVAGSVASRALQSKPVAELVEGSRFSQDLAVVGKDRVDFAAHLLVKVTTIVGLAIAVSLVSASTSLGSGSILMLAIGAVAFVVVSDIRSIQRRAEQRRIEILEAVTAFVEFTRLAAHTQTVEGAMRAAVGMGVSWPFRRLETVIGQAARHRQPPWIGMTALGHRYGMYELVELGGALENAGVEGTRVQAMLAAKATSLRRRMTETEIDKANSATQQLSVPLGLLGVVLVAVLLAPALLAF